MTRKRVEIDARFSTRVVHARKRDQRRQIAVAFAGFGEKDQMVELMVLGRRRKG
jgi:hypothetical protein